MAKTYADYLAEETAGAQQQQSAYEQQRKQQAQDAYDLWNQGASAQFGVARDAVNKQVEAVPQQYAKVYDANALQELISQRQLQEAMANAGLTDSGLNRTQQTGIALMRGNADRDTRLAQQSAVDALTQQLAQMEADWLAQQNNQRASVFGQADSDISNNWSNLWGVANSASGSRYGTDTNAALQREQQAAALAQWEREQAAQQAQWDYNNRLNERDVKAKEASAKAQEAAAQAQDANRLFNDLLKAALSKDDVTMDDAYQFALLNSGLMSESQIKQNAAEKQAKEQAVSTLRSVYNATSPANLPPGYGSRVTGELKDAMKAAGIPYNNNDSYDELREKIRRALS